jgi:hypothetical protein
VDPRTQCFVLELSSSQTKGNSFTEQFLMFLKFESWMKLIIHLPKTRRAIRDNQQSTTIKGRLLRTDSTRLSVEAMRVPCVHTRRIARPKTELLKHMQQRRNAMTECHSGVVIDWRFADTQQH